MPRACWVRRPCATALPMGEWSCWSGGEAGQAAVTPQKRRRLVQAARCYLGAHPEHAGRCVRFDVATVTGDGVSHVSNAFSGGEW